MSPTGATTRLCIWPPLTDTETFFIRYKLEKHHNCFILLINYVVQLLRLKSDVNFTNEHGNTPLHYACFWGYQSIAEDLIAQGALVSIANKDGDTPLDKARGTLSKQLHGTAAKTIFLAGITVKIKRSSGAGINAREHHLINLPFSVTKYLIKRYSNTEVHLLCLKVFTQRCDFFAVFI
jgi:Ankyrin repeats (many copies)